MNEQPGTQIVADNFTYSQDLFNKMGFSFPDFVGRCNNALNLSKERKGLNISGFQQQATIYYLYSDLVVCATPFLLVYGLLMLHMYFRS